MRFHDFSQIGLEKKRKIVENDLELPEFYYNLLREYLLWLIRPLMENWIIIFSPSRFARWLKNHVRFSFRVRRKKLWTRNEAMLSLIHSNVELKSIKNFPEKLFSGWRIDFSCSGNHELQEKSRFKLIKVIRSRVQWSWCTEVIELLVGLEEFWKIRQILLTNYRTIEEYFCGINLQSHLDNLLS